MISKQNLLATLWTLFFIFYLNVTYSQNVCESIKEYKALKKILIDTQNKNENITDKINSFNIENKNLSEAEKNIIISLLKSYSYGRLISIQDEELATFYLDKTKKLIGKNINRNHCLNNSNSRTGIFKQ